MKKLPIFERTDHDDSYCTDSITITIGNREAVATWKWDKEFDLVSCSSFYRGHKDIITKLGTPFYPCDKSEKLFLLGCSFGYSMTKFAGGYDADILDIT